MGQCRMTHLVLLDCEAVQAIGSRSHRKHLFVLAHAKRVAAHKMRREKVTIAVPTAVRAEAGWDRTSPVWALANQLDIADIALAGSHADKAAGIRNRTSVSVADAHIGAAIQAADADRLTVLTSDPRDIHLVAEGKRVQVVTV
jgi:hypothetical protein